MFRSRNMQLFVNNAQIAEFLRLSEGINSTWTKQVFGNILYPI